jgi:hypothetical protein
MISHKHKCIFIHVPKTGGSSIEQILGYQRTKEEIYGWDDAIGVPLQHASAQQLLDHDLVDRETFDRYFKFAFVRNPFDLVVSEWKWRINRRNFRPWSRDRWIQMSLMRFLKRHLAGKFKGEIGLRIRNHLTPQYEFIHDRNGKCLVDFVGRFENFAADLDHVAGVLNLEVKSVPHAKKTKRGHYSDYYDSETIDLVGKMYEKDLAEFGYRFQRAEGR